MSVPSSTAEAYKEIHRILDDKWLSDPVSQLVPLLYWDDNRQPPTDGGEYATVNIIHVRGAQSTIQNDLECRRDTLGMVLTLTIHTDPGNMQVKSAQLQDIAMSGLRRYQTTLGLIIRDVRPVEIGRSGSHFVTTVICSVEYDIIS